MTTLITGGTGFLARNLIPALQERGHAVRALALPGEDIGWLEQRGVAVSRGDIREPDTLRAPMRDVDCVYHLAALMGPFLPMKDYHAVNVTGTENVCRAALSAGVRRLIHISSWTVYGMNLGDPVTEKMPLRPLKEPYAVTKAHGDELVRRLVAEQGLPAVIVRPGTIFGPGDRLNFGRIADGLERRRWVTVGSGRNALPLVYVTDVVQGLLLALDAEHGVGQAYNITNDSPLTQQEAWSAIAEAIGARPPRIHVPYRPLCAVAYASERIAMLGNYRFDPLVTRHGAMLFGGDNRHSIDKARRELGYSPRVSLREGLGVTGQWYREEHPVVAPRGLPPVMRHDIDASANVR
jgi:nucleoside-diphosphate-sugar epimerase